jgi:acyl carrier protein
MENNHIDELSKEFKINHDEDLRYKLTSISMMMLIMRIEEIYNINIKTIDLTKTNTLEKIINEFINNKK